MNLEEKEKKDEKLAFHNHEFLDSHEARPIRIIAEYCEPKQRLKELNIEDTIIFFGSARIKSKKDAKTKREKEISKYYEDTKELSAKFTSWSMNEIKNHKRRFIMASGGGPGIMQATNEGAKKAKGVSIGLTITLPFEQAGNPYLSPRMEFKFHYFFIRKFWFSYLAKAIVVFPGGFGTMDELFEMLTLIQTKKIQKNIKIVLYGKEFWEKVINFQALVDFEVISKEDLKLFEILNDVNETFEKVTTHLKDNFL